mmetsp:Transcript_15780/g.37105  ORF Transcript_15780/g.37105 Transcript_15780/m.37105 type:complete len:203 (+) Transcript_15780:560-1168(+)
MIHDDDLLRKRLGQLDDVAQLLMEHPNFVIQAVLLQQCKATPEIGISGKIGRRPSSRDTRITCPCQTMPNSTHQRFLSQSSQCLVYIQMSKVCRCGDAVANVGALSVHLGRCTYLKQLISPARFNIDGFHHVVRLFSSVTISDVQQQVLVSVWLVEWLFGRPSKAVKETLPAICQEGITHSLHGLLRSDCGVPKVPVVNGSW